MGLKVRPPTEGDRQPLGGLMLDGYRGTMDDEGEDEPAAVRFVDEFLRAPRPTPEASVVAWSGPAPVGACLIGLDPADSTPFVFSIVTRSDWKGKGVGRLLLVEAIRRISKGGHRTLGAYITAGNTASEALFAGAGFEVEGEVPR